MKGSGYKRSMVEIVTEGDLRDDFGDDDWQDCAQFPTVPYAKLPHQCDAWIIGGAEEIEQMIRDLQTVLEQIRNVKG